MRTSWEQLSNTRCVKSFFCKTECGTETGSTGSNDDGIVCMVDNWVCAREGCLFKGNLSKELSCNGILSFGITSAAVARNGWFVAIL